MNLDDLAEMAEQARALNADLDHEVRVCMAASCQSSGSTPVFEALRDAVGEGHACKVKGVGCMGLCSAGPLVAIQSRDVIEPVLYRDVGAGDADEIAASLGGTPVERLRQPTDAPFFARQQKIVLENSGIIDPESFKGYIAVGGYSAMVQALTEMTPAEVLREMTTSGLRGRGGGGYPTGLKWSTIAKMPAEQKYVICNADEGDPGAFMDRAVLESDPHRVLEGMAIAAYAVGANKGFVYVRAEYPLAVDRLKTAIRKAKRSGFLGRPHLRDPVQLRGRDPPGRRRLRLRRGDGAHGLHRGRPRPAAPAPALPRRVRALGLARR